jgi:hypothetical protein
VPWARHVFSRLKSQFGLRIGLGVATEADARLIIAANLAALTHPGSGIVQQGRHGPPQPGRTSTRAPGRVHQPPRLRVR